jgi:hypothetical protein
MGETRNSKYNSTGGSHGKKSFETLINRKDIINIWVTISYSCRVLYNGATLFVSAWWSNGFNVCSHIHKSLI